MLSKYLPYSIFKPLFGDRKKFGLKPDFQDADWIKWQNSYHLFYNDNQKEGVGKTVNHYGFKISSLVDIQDKVVLEIGPGTIEHLDYNSAIPQKYYLADIDEKFLAKSKKVLSEKYKIGNIETIVVERDSIPVADESLDIVFTFHQLEHVVNLEEYVLEIDRILKPGGYLVGAVPCEGALAWGLGRYFTSRKYVRKNMDFDYDKIICWEHPNFVDKIQRILNGKFTPIQSRKKPFSLLPLDFNLSWSFVFQKK